MNQKINLLKLNNKELKKVNGGGYYLCHCVCDFDPDYEVSTMYNYAVNKYNDKFPMPS